MYEWCMNDIYMARPPKIVIVLSVLPNWNKIVNQSINQTSTASQSATGLEGHENKHWDKLKCVLTDDDFDWLIDFIYIKGKPEKNAIAYLAGDLMIYM